MNSSFDTYVIQYILLKSFKLYLYLILYSKKYKNIPFNFFIKMDRNIFFSLTNYSSRMMAFLNLSSMDRNMIMDHNNFKDVEIPIK